MSPSFTHLLRSRGVRAVGFDLDDTLIDHLGASRAAYGTFAAGVGLPTDEEGHARWLGAERRWYAEYRAGRVSFAGQRRGRLRDVFDAAGVLAPRGDDSLDGVFAAYRAAYEAAWRVFPDVEGALRALHGAGLPVGVLTNGDPAQQRSKLRLLPPFDAVCISGELGVAKPDADAFHALATGLGTPVEAIVFVGDDRTNDLEGALTAGMRAALVDRGSGESLAEALLRAE